jgi:hypothetical protein
MHQRPADIGRSLAPRRAVRTRVMFALVLASVIGIGSAGIASARDPDWDQVENVKDAARRLAVLQRTQGATKVFAFIDACYRTHSLSSQYTKAFEACIAQDYMESQILSLIYSRTPPDALKRQGAPSPQMIVATMQRRVGSAFAQYKIPKERIAQLQRVIDEHGFPLFFSTVFPGTKPPPIERVPAGKDAAPSSAPEKAPDKQAPDEPAQEKKQ